MFNINLKARFQPALSNELVGVRNVVTTLVSEVVLGWIPQKLRLKPSLFGASPEIILNWNFNGYSRPLAQL